MIAAIDVSSPVFGFVVGVLVTVVLLAAVLFTGFTAQRKRHIPLVVLYFVALGTTIFFAERMGRELDLEAAGAITTIHLTLAKITTLSWVFPVITGVRTLRHPERKKQHRTVALVLVAMTVVTLVTGLWMVSAAQPLP